MRLPALLSSHNTVVLLEAFHTVSKVTKLQIKDLIDSIEDFWMYLLEA